MDDNGSRYEPARAVMAEGARVGLLTCRSCGAVLLLDPDASVDVTKQHNAWHEQQAQS